jgi:hypothetical protein
MAGVLSLAAVVLAALLYWVAARALARYGREQRYGRPPDQRPAPWRELLLALTYAGVLEVALVLAGLRLVVLLALAAGGGD